MAVFASSKITVCYGGESRRDIDYTLAYSPYTVFVKSSVVCKHPGWCLLLVRKLCPQFVRVAEALQTWILRIQTTSHVTKREMDTTPPF